MKTGRGKPKRRWIQNVKETLRISIDEVGDLASDRGSFRWAVKRATFY
jgi:hypothetical protein